VQYYNIPIGVTSVRVDTYGASGGITYAPNPAGNGGYMSCIIDVSRISILYVYVGSAGNPRCCNMVAPGGWNGGGSTQVYGRVGCCGGTGGGASDVRTSLGDLTSRLVVAGGGGGGVNCYGGRGGAGGGLSASAGTSYYGGGGGGGTQNTVGAGVAPGSPGLFGVGGNGGEGICLGSYNCGGGAGGGGWFGGGGHGGSGYTAGGGGGSSYCIPSGQILNNKAGSRNGNGSIIITIHARNVTFGTGK
jgi:hypothetical protein